jgi:flagellar assembly protein FliH
VQAPSPREDVLAAARAEAETIVAEARVRGHEEGLAAGLAEASAQLEPARSALLAAAASLEAAAADVVEAGERRAVELALLLAEKILHTALDVDPELVASVARGALRRVSAAERIVLEVNPEDVGLTTAALGDAGRLDVVGDRRIPRGGCVVRTAEGEIDARIEEQLARAADVLRESFA